jgi:hypothetical protein
VESLIQSINAAFGPDATDEAKHHGALACRTILAHLEPQGEAAVQRPEPVAPSTPARSPMPSPAEIAALVTMLRGMPLDQLFDHAIERLRAALPKDAPSSSPSGQPLRFQIVNVAPLAPSKIGGG